MIEQSTALYVAAVLLLLAGFAWFPIAAAGVALGFLALRRYGQEVERDRKMDEAYQQDLARIRRASKRRDDGD